MKSKSLNHSFLAKPLPKTDDGKINENHFNVKINRIGDLSISAIVDIKKKNPLYPEKGKPYIYESKNIAWKLFDPLGQQFTKSNITMVDLNKYRDVEGFIRPWKLVTEKLSGISENELTTLSGSVSLTVLETIPSSSASPIISTETVIKPFKEYEFDLYRLGHLKVKITYQLPLSPIVLPSTANIKLIRPDGSIKATISNGGDVPILQSDIKQSRGANGKVNKWKLRIESDQSGKHKINVQVYDTLTIKRDVLLDRLIYLLGPNGENIEFKIKWYGDKETNIFKLLIKDQILAENADNYDVFDPSETKAEYKKIEKDIEYIISDSVLGTENYHLKFNNFTLDSINISMGASVERKSPKVVIDPGWNGVIPELGSYDVVTVIPANLPKISFDLNFSNTFDFVMEYLVDINPSPWHETKIDLLKDITGIRVNKIQLEIAFDVDSPGNLKCWCWIKLDTAAPSQIDYLLQAIINSYLVSQLNDSMSEVAESIFANMLGGLFKLTDSRWSDSALKIDYITDIIPENTPLIGYVPSRGYISQQVGVYKNTTWKSPLLTDDPNKIKHIIVLMMENRSFDHVLGYLSLERPLVVGGAVVAGPGGDNQRSNAINPNVDGLTNEVIAKYSDDKNRIRHLKHAKFKANYAGLKTQIPVGVGHEIEDVLEQIDKGTMKGFVKNFEKYNRPEAFTDNNVEHQDVLGYYTDEELAMYKFLADNFTICDNYFSSLPGATLPNRMFSLTGHLKIDNNGEPIKKNALASPFLISRDQTIFDILSQHEVSWRVYESFPSVTMLRMFSRYAGDNVHIKDVKDLSADILEEEDFPSVVFIDPAMHDMPANDDHPPADMLRGQHFVKEIYTTLRNSKVWDNCLFVVTYDEHGGLFDHVSPIVAEIFQDPQKVRDRQQATGMGSTGNVSISSKAASDYMDDKPNIYGVRVPTFLVSPYVEKGGVYKRILDHTSILKTILIRFCGKDSAFMSDRVNYAFDLGGALKEAHRNITAEPPKLLDLKEKKFTKSKLLQNMKNFKIMSKTDLFDKSFDFHEYMSFLGRMVKPFK